ncbi:MAG: TolC family protein [Firmicutes bacterium]|nr:TolC family protein [Bacillota bacterium]
MNSSIDSNLTLMASATKLDVELPEIDPSKLYGAPGGSYDWRQQDTGYGSGEATKVNPWQIELSFSYRFGDGGARQAKIDAKEAAIEKAKLQVEMAENGCYLELYSCLQQLDQALRAYELAVESQRAARETLEQLEAMYERGSVTAKEVREGRLLVIQAQNRVVDAAFAYEAAKAKLAAAMGAAPDALIAALGRNQWDALMDN